MEPLWQICLSVGIKKAWNISRGTVCLTMFKLCLSCDEVCRKWTAKCLAALWNLLRAWSGSIEHRFNPFFLHDIRIDRQPVSAHWNVLEVAVLFLRLGLAALARFFFFSWHTRAIFISGKGSSSSVGYLLLVKTSGGLEYPCVLYCKVKGISKKERMRERNVTKSIRCDFGMKQLVIYQNSATCESRVCSWHTVCKNVKKKFTHWSLFFFLTSKCCWCCTVSNSKPNLYI